jgi:hypothetical protein
MFSAIINGNPDTRFYDYTKLGSESIAPNHHLTYSSTGFGQIVDGKKVFFKDKSGKYDHNWATMRQRLNNGQNVAMAFSSKTGIPSFLTDEETGVQYKVWNGDDYDARFLDPAQPDGKGMIIGLKNKAGTLSERNATQKTGGFFVQYDPKTDGDTVVVPTQAQFKGIKDIGVQTKKFSLAIPDNPAFKAWFGNSKIVDQNGVPRVMYHGTARDIGEFQPKQANAIFLTDDIDFAEEFASRSKDYMVKQAADALDKQKIKKDNDDPNPNIFIRIYRIIRNILHFSYDHLFTIISILWILYMYHVFDRDLKNDILRMNVFTMLALSILILVLIKLLQVLLFSKRSTAHNAAAAAAP